MREWLSGRASPCQGERREFESRLPLQFIFWGKREEYARLAELADAPDLGSGGRPWGFKSLIAHHSKRDVRVASLLLYVRIEMKGT